MLPPNYSDNLPREHKGKEVCQQLNDDGNRCEKTANFEVEIFDKLHDGWFSIFLCGKCCKKLKIKTTQEYSGN